jgi:hypothetical protein
MSIKKTGFIAHADFIIFSQDRGRKNQGENSTLWATVLKIVNKLMAIFTEFYSNGTVENIP